MKDILEEITAWKRREVEDFKRQLPERDIHAMTERMLGGSVPSLRKAVATSENGIIAEFKRKSPSKGWIKESGRADVIPMAYERNGAAAVSILTDSRFFGGDDSFVSEARRSGVTLPILYKNFITDEYQLFQARLCGASAVLLIAAVLGKDECRTMIRTAHELQLEVLLEMHDEYETEYADLGPDLCGINNRNLGTFVTDVANSVRLAPMLPNDAVKVSESGISSPETIKALHLMGYSGFLIGENFMKADDPGAALKDFAGKSV
ncbi:MAG: indole-3-glycerol phosphate synthase TrpC [Prevotella sp.]|nr:indole-3-glycerol phosphate synthase TrpC [Prevotella sp.]